jgi:hypothetical protein
MLVPDWAAPGTARASKQAESAVARVVERRGESRRRAPSRNESRIISAPLMSMAAISATNTVAPGVFDRAVSTISLRYRAGCVRYSF